MRTILIILALFFLAYEVFCLLWPQRLQIAHRAAAEINNKTHPTFAHTKLLASLFVVNVGYFVFLWFSSMFMAFSMMMPFPAVIILIFYLKRLVPQNTQRKKWFIVSDAIASGSLLALTALKLKGSI